MATANKQNPTAADAAKTETVKGLRVIARSDSFRRAGYAFGAEPVEIPLSKLSNAQVKALRDERQLVVIDIEIEVPAAADAPKE